MLSSFTEVLDSFVPEVGAMGVEIEATACPSLRRSKRKRSPSHEELKDEEDYNYNEPEDEEDYNYDEQEDEEVEEDDEEEIELEEDEEEEGEEGEEVEAKDEKEEDEKEANRMLAHGRSSSSNAQRETRAKHRKMEQDNQNIDTNSRDGLQPIIEDNEEGDNDTSRSPPGGVDGHTPTSNAQQDEVDEKRQCSTDYKVKEDQGHH